MTHARDVASHSSFGRSLSDEVQFLKGVGPQGAQLLNKMGLFCVGDVLRHIPRRYEDRTQFRLLSDVRPGEFATIRARVVAAETLATRRKNLQITRVLLDDGTGVCQISFFQQPYLLRSFKSMADGERSIIVYGLVKRSGYGPPELERVEWEEVSDESDPLGSQRIVPIYPLTEGITQKRMRRIVWTCLEGYANLLTDWMPPTVARQASLIEAVTAIQNVHFPASGDLRDAARHRLVFEEFFLLQVGLARRRLTATREAPGYRFEVNLARIEAELRAILPFELTGAQKAAIADIGTDMSSGRVMNRLVQGDVGSGKTMVALAALFMAHENGFQAALMAPTEILAQQHAISLRALLEPLGIRVELSIGSQRAKEKAAVKVRLATGQSHIAIGTHALIQDDVEFHKLGLVIIDEQHRFGVLQRQALHQKGQRPHILVMTATPIPRTLTLTIYGDLDTSVIGELPPGRKPIKTHWKSRREADSVYGAMQRLLSQGRQAYVVCPLVEESEKLQVKAASQLAEHIQSEVLPNYRVGLLHGQMPAAEKDEVMRRFKAHELDVLVSTTVIEVGIDVPNATVIVIEDADRFGLAQLHQLRGRVGRGEHASFCVLLADPKTEVGQARMSIMTETQDGFRIAEEDLKLRGPGEFFGTRQSGLPEFYIADILRDSELMDLARETAFELVDRDPNLGLAEHVALRHAVESSRLGLELIKVS